MPAQPNAPAVIEWDVTNLEVSIDPDPWAPTFIIPANQPFQLQASFEGTGGGMTWEAMKGMAATYSVQLFAEDLGPAPGINLGIVPGNLNGAQNAYQNTLNVAGGLPAGVYFMTCVVTFNPPWIGTVGFFRDLIVVVY
jgi:hypothetical protein